MNFKIELSRQRVSTVVFLSSWQLMDIHTEQNGRVEETEVFLIGVFSHFTASGAHRSRSCPLLRRASEVKETPAWVLFSVWFQFKENLLDFSTVRPLIRNIGR